MNGLLIQMSAIEIGTLALSHKQRNIPGIIWKGMGRKQQKKPTKNATDTEWRLKCHRLF